MPRIIDANQAVKHIRQFKVVEPDDGHLNNQSQGINRGINLACRVLQNNNLLPAIQLTLPKKRIEKYASDVGDRDSGFIDGWNACIDEIKRLTYKCK